MIRTLVALALAAGCGGAYDAQRPDGGSPADAGNFGKPCTGDVDCPGGVCGLFDMSGMLCTVPCTSAASCPAGSMGQKCNMRGQCRP